VHVPSLILIGLMTLSVAQGVAQSPGNSAPETFSASAEVKAAAGAINAPIQIHIQRYTPDFDRTAVEAALKGGGYPAFLTALRKAPEVGSVAVGNQKVPIRWAREQKTAAGRTIVVVTDKPVYFVGGGSTAAKPRAGYEVAVIELLVDDAGRGSGSMAAAARVKPGGETGVRIDDYADEPITLVTVSRKLP
jgi:hypothetical protein